MVGGGGGGGGGVLCLTSTIGDKPNNGRQTAPECPFLLKQIATLGGPDEVDGIPSCQLRCQVQNGLIWRVDQGGDESSGGVVGWTNTTSDRDGQQ